MTLKIILKSLALDPDDSFKSVDEFIYALINGEEPLTNLSENKHGKTRSAKAKGFAAIAGMENLKKLLQRDVIDALHNPKEYAKYGLSIPNGMLLYGPPGCGKTFFAKHFAEEVGFNYMEVKPSTLKSCWVNETQENIGKMFKEAAERAPTIIFIDEMNELVPNRDSDVHEMSLGAVNEMLAQMDRTGEKGVFIIGATNYPNMIDPAILRAGRLDRKYYIGPPDQVAREAIIKLYLKDRPCDSNIDCVYLAKLTDGYVSADLKLIIDDASRIALHNHAKISQAGIEKVISQTKPSISSEELRMYATIKAKMDER